MSFDKSYASKDPVTKYCTENSLRLHPLQKKLQEETLSKRRDAMMVGAPEVVQLNCNLMKAINAKKVLDIGVFTGYSAFSAALTIPNDGIVVACDISDKAYKEIGEKYVNEAGVAHKIHFPVEPASKTLDDLIAKGESGTFDFAFIDADKPGYDTYYEKCLILMRPGGIIAFDNTIWSGQVLNPKPGDDDTQALVNIVKKVHKDTRVNCSMLREGDGLLLAFKL